MSSREAAGLRHRETGWILPISSARASIVTSTRSDSPHDVCSSYVVSRGTRLDNWMLHCARPRGESVTGAKLEMAHSKRVIYYYQTFVGLKQVLKPGTPVDVLNVSSLHFGSDSAGSPYIHLNDHDPDWDGFDTLWSQTQAAQRLGVKVMLMLGGAGGAYRVLFSNFDTYYGLLKDTIKKRPWITGIDLDIEEPASLDNVKLLIRCIDSDFGPDFTITMAPVATSLQSDAPDPFSGFSYKDLYTSTEGKRINWFNGQFYSSWGGFTESSYNAVVTNGYPPAKVVMGMLSTDFSAVDFRQALGTVERLTASIDDFGGVSDWEYFEAPPGAPDNPIEWANLMSAAMNKINVADITIA